MSRAHCRMSWDVGKAREGVENELWHRWSDWKVGEWAELIVVVIAELILQPFRHFTYVTVHSPTLPSFYIRHSSFSNPSFASPTSQDFHLRHLASSPRHSLQTNHLSYWINWNNTCVCVPMPFHCTITCFWFRARRIDGVESGLFSTHAPLGQTTLRVGLVSV